ncbi:hypothetical protein [Haliangium sp.]|uniref:hypothetical protein n=1 Tax=Haliangium sp. TaxID=2663208 RepID=UPI003D129EC9
MRCVHFLVRQMDESGAYTTESDLGAYYKSLWLLHLAGRNHLAYRRLRYIKNTFLQSDGDFLTAPDLKTANGVLVQYYPYTNGWIAMASHKLGRFDVAQPAHAFVKTFSDDAGGGYTIAAPFGEGDDVTEVFITSHLGLLSLYFGDIERAMRAGDFVLDVLHKQPDLDDGLYLRVAPTGDLITSFPDDAAALHVVKRTEPFQLYFFVGYPIAFLAKLYEATGDSAYLTGAMDYLAFAQSCDESLYSFNFSHKVGWAASIVARLTGDTSARETATRIADYLLSIQDASGGWLLDQPPLDHLDQSAEIATWLLELSAELGA